MRAPIAVKVVDAPLQLVAEVTLILGSGATVTMVVNVPIHEPDCATSVYIVVLPGLTVLVDPFEPDGSQV